MNKESFIAVLQIQTNENSPQYTYEIFINGVKVLSVFNDKPEKFENVKYYASDPWYQSAKATITDFKVNVYKHTGERYYMGG